jgi:hypothetical protein
LCVYVCTSYGQVKFDTDRGHVEFRRVTKEPQLQSKWTRKLSEKSKGKYIHARGRWIAIKQPIVSKIKVHPVWQVVSIESIGQAVVAIVVFLPWRCYRNVVKSKAAQAMFERLASDSKRSIVGAVEQGYRTYNSVTLVQ